MKDKKTRTQERIEKRNESYNDYVEQVTPKHSCLKNCAQAFVTGGIICTVGQAVMNMYMLWNDSCRMDNSYSGFDKCYSDCT